MRTLVMMASALALGAAGVAEAGPRGAKPGGWNGPRPGGWNGPRPGWNGGHVVRPRWGGRISGRWWGGMRAPGGWGAYRRPVRGWVLPGYWVQPNWYINDWSGYGLPQPPYGYNWSRYYDDAVLIDGRGTVYDSVGGIGWDRFDGQGVDYTYYEDGYGAGYAGGGYATAPQLPYPGPDADGGLGGAIVGGVVGGVAGNLIAGRGNRLGGTLIGAGAGALVGQAIDKSDGAGRVHQAPPPYGAPGYGAPYPAPGHPGPAYGHPVPEGAPQVAYQTGSYGGDYAGTTYSGVTYYGAAPAPAAPIPRSGAYPPAPYHGAPATVVAGNGTVVTTTQAGGGYVAGGYYFPGATVTTVTVSNSGGEAYEEVYEDSASYTKGKARRYTKGGCNC